MMLSDRLTRPCLTLVAGLLVAAGAFGLTGVAHADDAATPSVQAIANAPGWITVLWTSDASASQYTLQRKDTSVVRSVGADGSLTDTGLKANTTYAYRVCADTDCSAWASATTLPAPGGGSPGGGGSPSGGTPAGAPTDVHVSNIGPTGVTVNWTVGSHAAEMLLTCVDTTDPAAACGKGQDLYNFWWQPEPSSNPNEGVWAGLDPDPPNTVPTSFADPNLRPDHNYTVTVCDAGAGSSTLACAAPITFRTPPNLDMGLGTFSPTCQACGSQPTDINLSPDITPASATCAVCGRVPASTDGK